MAEPDVRVLANDVAHVQSDMTGFKRDQAILWEQNRETHKDLYSKLDRLPAWATLLIAVLSALASGATVAAVKAYS